MMCNFSRIRRMSRKKGIRSSTAHFSASRRAPSMLKTFLESKIQVEKNTYIVRKESSDFVAGSERMVAVGGGIKARLAKTKSGTLAVQEFLFDRDRFAEESVSKWLKDNASTFEKSLLK